MRFVVVVLLLLFLGASSSKKSLRLRCFKLDCDKIWHDCSSSCCWNHWL